VITVTREPRDVFAARSLASFTGKPITVGHPGTEVAPDNYRALAVGHVVRARQGKGADADVVLGDLFITDPRTADQVQRGALRALSVGYTADYIPTGPGSARQVDIVANHLALLRDGEARCGPRCAIGDDRSKLTVDARHFMRTSRARARREQAAGAAMAKRITDFWQK
jgi:hypothetical protein